MKIQHRFVECIPDSIDSGVLYISLTYATAIHLCICGCGKEVVTPFSPTDWKLIFDGETVSLTPSIGNWSFPCCSHYFIKRNRIELAGKMTKQAIDNNREYDRQLKIQQYSKLENYSTNSTDESVRQSTQNDIHALGFLNRIMSFFKK